MNVQRHLTVQFEKGDARTEYLQGREYYVVPTIAMVEGVRFGANQSNPELGLASEFGDNPITWANRPLVLNHPKTSDGYVSANSPDILEDYQFGLTMNPEVTDGKLHLEAWIDVTRVQELGGEFLDTYDRIVAQEDVEVSVGFFSDLKEEKGTFKGQAYNGLWTNIKPDHLAVLSEGTLGACSVKDGCGIPRINEVNMPKELKGAAASCSCQEPATQKNKPKGSVPSIKPNSDGEIEVTLEQAAADAREEIRRVNRALLTQSIPADMLNSDASKLISRALNKKFGSYTYLYAFSSNEAYFEVYNYDVGGYKINKIGINVTENAVDFVGDPQEVLLLTKVVTPTEASSMNVNQENTMADDKVEQPKVEAKSEPEVKEPQAQQEQKKVTAQEYIDQAPPEVREALQTSMNLLADKRNAAMKTLKDAGSKFSEDELKAMSLDTLEKMVDLLPPSYKGVATPSNPVVHSADESKSVPVVRAFERKQDKAA